MPGKASFNKNGNKTVAVQTKNKLKKTKKNLGRDRSSVVRKPW